MADYYIDWKNGNDTTGTGATGAPWKSLTKALATVANNDRIYARGSDALDTVYREYALSTARTGITIAADTGHTPTWTPATSYTAWALTGGTLVTYETAYVAASAWFVMNGDVALTSRASIALVEANENSFFFDDTGNMLYVHIAGGGAPTDIEVFSSVSGLLTSAGTGITYTGLRMQWCGMGLYFNTAGSATGCTVRYHGGAYLGSRYCYRVDAAVAVTLTNCAGSGQYAATGGTGTIGAAVTVAGGTLNVVGCTFSRGLRGVLAQVNSTVNITTSTFYYIEDCITFAIATVVGNVSYCLFYDYGHGAIQYSGANVTGTAHHNLAYALAVPTIQAINTYICEGGATAAFYHCTVGDLDGSSSNGIGFYVLTGGTMTVKNCIAWACKEGFKNNIGSPGTVVSDYNCAFACTVGNYQNWTAGANEITADPLFVNAAAYDYGLQSGSPCRLTGTYLLGISEWNPTSRGRYEYTAGAGAILASAIFHSTIFGSVIVR